MKVVEIFKSIDGEGIRAGVPVTFIRFAGCNLRCAYCDTKYSYQDAKYEEMTVNDIYKKVIELGLNKITLTGGEPLLQQELPLLVRWLTAQGIEVNIETNGSLNVSEYCGKDNVIVTMDYKCPCSDMENQMYLPNLKKLTDKDVLKFVVGSKQDLDKVREILEEPCKAQVFISPVFGNIEPKDIVEYILENNLDARVQLQLHKIIWDPDMKGV